MKYSYRPILTKYLKKHRKGILFFLLLSFIFTSVFYLYNLPVEAVVYATILSAILGAIFLILGFNKYFRKHIMIYELQDRIMLSTDGLPEPKDLLEEDYQKLIRILFHDKEMISSNAENSKSELIEYYTLWVHQIKTPISAMRLLLQTEDTEPNSELSMELFKIEQYVEMVLQYLRLGYSSSDLVIKQYNLDDIVRQAIRKYAKMFIRKKIKLKYDSLTTFVLTDEKWLVFVIEQLLSNALKYTLEGNFCIEQTNSKEHTISTEQAITTERTISIYMDYENKKTLVIEDTGIGIAAEDLPRVFDKGYTGYNGRTDKKSTGIGLYLCKNILAKLSHNISIESEVGKGTKVMIGLDTVPMTFE